MKKFITLLTISFIWAADGPKIYISSDMEGVVGAVTGEQLGPSGFEYQRFREFMTAEVNAAIEGARSAGAGEILVADSHGNGVLRYDTPFFIAGGNRAGRPPEVRQQILAGLIDRLSTIAGVSKDLVSGHISEAPASWIMEAGHILPDPGSETADWYEHSAVSG